MNIVAWNFEWATRRSGRYPMLEETMLRARPEISALSEVTMTALPSGHVLDASEDWGYPAKKAQRKIALISQQPWQEIQRPSESRPLMGRLVSGLTNTSHGPVRVIGICIPWSFCHVTAGERDKKRWQEHGDFIDAMGTVLDACPKDLPLIVAGDWNQTFPPKRVAPQMHQKLTGLLDDHGLKVATADMQTDYRVLNHIAVRGLDVTARASWSNTINGKRVSDHAGVMVAVE